MNRTFIQRAICFSVISCFAHAQTAPDAGSLRQQLDQDRLNRLPGQAAPELRGDPPVTPSTATSTVSVNTFRFEGNTLLGDAQLQAVVAGYLNRPLSFEQLQAVAAAVADAYRDAGWVVRTYLPRQDVTDGTVIIRIDEARFGKVQVEGAEPTRLKLDYALSSLESRQKKGEPLNAEALERAILLVDDLPGVAASGALRAGAGEGETDLVLKLTDEPLVIGDVGIDNAGMRSTGRERIAASVGIASPFGIGDLVSIHAIHSQGLDYARVGYSVPIGHDGLRLGVNGSTLHYSLVSPEFSALNARGKSSTLGLDATYPLIRSRRQNLYLVMNYDQKTFENTSDGAISSRYGARSGTVGLSGNLFDGLGGGGANSATLLFTHGDLDLDGSPNRAADATTTRTAGRYEKLRYTLARQQSLTPTLSFLAMLSGQEASKNLDSSEKFYLGGLNGVRAYPLNEGGGAEGKVVNLELRWKLNEAFLLSGFYDWGHVTVNRNNRFTGAAAVNSFSLRGAGLALGWQSSQGLNLRLTWARRIGDNPNATSTGLDQDGTLHKDRFWLTASMPF
ncbi:ShlB/FhaC/HecB family hemolysin secretion/activation protein [Methyloversatilis thermotolerans]|uniref:ShlB/FhaC/HecB family hemolysin secretion/activation protein n=1 Tax=Methyloversatilis thermotolerans TaxID=1346290 RepID=UPI000362E75A|nr:ShlB/FhaC/HecB family hemolysin secretion/activation protein [Methyloversatilis thermotolerans]